MHVLGSGRVAWATEIPPPLFVYWKHIAAFAFGAVTTTSATVAIMKKIGLSIGTLLLERPTVKRSFYNGALGEYSTVTAEAHEIMAGPGVMPAVVRRDARAAMKLPAVSFHAFRHSHASMLIRAGVDILTVSRRLGHANASITLNVYGHLIEGADAAAAKAIEGVLK